MATNKAISGGVSVLVLVIFAVIGITMVNQSQLTQEFDIDNETEWNNYQDTISGLEVTTDGYLQLQTDNTSGTYTATLDSNESDANRYVVFTNIPDEDNSTSELTVSGDTYTLNDGENKFDVTSASSFELSLNRDSTSVSTPQVDSVVGWSGDSGLLGLVAGMAFALLVLLGLVNSVGLNRVRRAV